MYDGRIGVPFLAGKQASLSATPSRSSLGPIKNDYQWVQSYLYWMVKCPEYETEVSVPACGERGRGIGRHGPSGGKTGAKSILK
jgi:hypothetical protein